MTFHCSQDETRLDALTVLRGSTWPGLCPSYLDYPGHLLTSVLLYPLLPSLLTWYCQLCLPRTALSPSACDWRRVQSSRLSRVSPCSSSPALLPIPNHRFHQSPVPEVPFCMSLPCHARDIPCHTLSWYQFLLKSLPWPKRLSSLPQSTLSLVSSEASLMTLAPFVCPHALSLSLFAFHRQTFMQKH